MLEIIALAFVAIISIIVPLAVLLFLMLKHKERWKRILLLFFCGAVLYGTMQWGIKEHGLTWLFNNTDFMDFMNNHYIPYLLVVAMAGSALAILSFWFLIAILMKKKIAFQEAIAIGLGYSMLESILLIGIRSISTIIELIKNPEMQITTNTAELFLSGYERILITVIEIALVVAVTYFIQQNMPGKGTVITIMVHTLVTFLPGFFIAFTLKDYYEVYDRSVALGLVYVVLTATAITGIVIMNSLKYHLKD